MAQKGNNKKEELKKKHDIGKIATRVMAAILALMMVLAVAATLIYYIV